MIFYLLKKCFITNLIFVNKLKYFMQFYKSTISNSISLDL